MKLSFLDSLWKPSFYQKTSGTFSFGNGLVRLVLVNVFIGCVIASLMYISTGRQIPSYSATFVAEAVAGYPSDLVLHLKDGVLTKNIPGVLRLYPLESLYKDGGPDLTTKDTPHFMFTIDETQEASLAAFTASDAIMFFGEDGMVSKSNNDIRVQSYKNLDGINDVSFSKDTLTYFASFITKYVQYVPGILFVFVVLSYSLFAPMMGVLSSLFFGLIVMLLSASLLGRKRTYTESYLLSLYALPTVLLVKLVVTYIPFVSSATAMIPFFTTILVVIFLWQMFRTNQKVSVTTTHDTL